MGYGHGGGGEESGQEIEVRAGGEGRIAQGSAVHGDYDDKLELAGRGIRDFT